jgi:outer membrane protein assembly factor BamB
VRRALARSACLGIAVVGLVASQLISATTSPALASSRRPRPRPATMAAVEAGLAPVGLTTPLSREVVEPGSGGDVVVLGGLTAAGTSADGVYSLDPIGGASRFVGTLPTGVHDASGARIDGRDVVFGGGSPATVATVMAFGGPSGSGTGSVVGQLPTPRSDSASVTVGRTTYIVGGYNGSVEDPEVLATTDGQSFANVARLVLAVRYPAVAAAGGRIYVFGGERVGHGGGPVNLIQEVDPRTHMARVIGHLPEPLAGSVAVNLGGTIYLAGGTSTVLGPVTPGMGVTAVAPPVTNGAATVSTVWAFDVRQHRLLDAGRLQVPVAHAGVAVVRGRAWIVGGELNGVPVSSVQFVEPNRSFGTAGAPGAGSPYFGGELLIADRGNNRLLLLNPAMRVVWTYPAAGSPPNPDGFYFPDDAFFVDHGHAILTNQEENETIEEIAYPSGRLLWSYGHPGQAGSAPGYLHEPDDAYLLRNGQITVADADNCRVLVINPDGTAAHQIGTTGVCQHNPPISMGSPNGDTPLPDGNLLVSEINGSWVSEYTLGGQLIWDLQLPISYPSDPQQLGSDLYLIADYASPGQVLEFTRQGQITWRYDVGSGPGELNHPSLAERLPSGVIMLNDDYNDRVVAIDPATDALVWQYGVTGEPGTAPGLLNTPDGFDLLLPGGATPTHPATG